MLLWLAQSRGARLQTMLQPHPYHFWPLLLLLLLQAVLPMSGLLQAADLYVAATGNDANPGTQARPFREIRRALRVIAPGDTVHVGPGAYKGFDAVGIGAADKVTRLVSADRQAVITKTTDRGVNDRYNMEVWRCTNFVIEGLQSYGAERAGMRLVECRQVTVRHCIFGNNQHWGIVTSHSDDLVIEYNDCYGSLREHGIYVSNSGDRPVVRGNRLHDNVGSGLRSNGDISQGGDGIISGAVIENNIIYNNGSQGGAAINADGHQGGIIRNNVIYNNHSTGIALFKGGGAEGPKDMKVLNNTIIQAASARYCLRLTDLIGPVLVRNNFLYNHNALKGPFSWNTAQEAAWTDSDYNAFGGGSFVSVDGEMSRISLPAWMAGGRELHSLTGVSPGAALADESRHDYRLRQGSPLTDAGIFMGEAAADHLGVARPLGAGTDMGAYEYGAFDAWKEAQGLAGNIPDDDDGDNDDIPLLMEYALGSNPHAFSREDLPVMDEVTGQLNLKGLPLRPDLLYGLEESPDLVIWSRPLMEASLLPLMEEGYVGLSGKRRFLRLLVRRP